MSGPASDWNDQAVQVLRALWADEGITAREIAKRLRKIGVRVSRSAVIGKAYRLGLAARATPTSGEPVAARMRAAPTPPRIPPCVTG